MALLLTREDEHRLSGDDGPAVELAMRVLVKLAKAMGAENLLDITGAHVDSCLFHGRATLDFAERLIRDGAQVVVPTTLNVSSLDLLHPELYRGDAENGQLARRLMDAYVSMGCSPTWTCAPYQLEKRPGFGEHVAWAESNAIVFANSVLGARTDRYGDFVDSCAAITGRVPAAGLHLSTNRWATVAIRLVDIGSKLLESSVLAPVLGALVGSSIGSRVPVLEGFREPPNEDWLKAFGAAAASTGGVGMFHVVGATPEAPSFEAAVGGGSLDGELEVGIEDLRRVRALLTTASGGDLGTISLGTPHYSVGEFERLLGVLDGRTIHPDIDFFVSTGRGIFSELEDRGWAEQLQSAGVTIVTDTCTYVTPILRDRTGVVMTDSAKWAYYAPGNLGVEVVFASLTECAESAIAGFVSFDDTLWDCS